MVNNRHKTHVLRWSIAIHLVYHSAKFDFCLQLLHNDKYTQVCKNKRGPFYTMGWAKRTYLVLVTPRYKCCEPISGCWCIIIMLTIMGCSFSLTLWLNLWPCLTSLIINHV